MSDANSLIPPHLKDIVDTHPHHGMLLHLIYCDLYHVKQWKLLEPKVHQGKCCLVGQQTASDSVRLVIPLGEDDEITMADLLAYSEYSTQLKIGEDGIYLGIVGRDSSISYYALSRGIENKSKDIKASNDCCTIKSNN